VVGGLSHRYHLDGESADERFCGIRRHAVRRAQFQGSLGPFGVPIPEMGSAMVQPWSVA
jgi:hypothetical protein